MSNGLDVALTAWRALLGDPAVIQDATALRSRERATFPTSHGIQAILLPGSVDEVAGCLRIANEHTVAIYPLSTGKNWGFGSAVPPHDGCVVMELARMNRILDHNEELAYVTVEPGVTFRQLFMHLEATASRLSLGMTGGSRDGSVLANAIERGLVSGQHCDRFGQVAALDVVLPTGERLRREPGGGTASPVSAVHRWGLGPCLDGLFSQSNLGVVVAATIWLSPTAFESALIYAAVSEDDGLGSLALAIRELMLDGLLTDGVGIKNDYAELARLQQYPWAAMVDETPLPRAVLERMKALLGRRALWSGRWNARLSLAAASAGEMDAKTETFRKRLLPVVDRLVIIGGQRTTVEAWDQGVDREHVERSFLREPKRGGPEDADRAGVPDALSLNLPYWRKRSAPPLDKDPDRDGCGFIYLAPVVPLTADAIRECVAIESDALTSAGFEPIINVLIAEPRAAHVIAAIVYDRDEPGEDQRAMQCHDEILDAVMDRGYAPYRVGIRSMSAMAMFPDRLRVARTIKAALDPGGVLAPGRYVR